MILKTRQKIAITIILTGVFLPILLYPLSSPNPFDDLINQGSVQNFLVRSITLGDFYFTFQVPVALSILLILLGTIVIIFSIGNKIG